VELLKGEKPREIAKLLKVDYFTVYQILMGREEILEMPKGFPGFKLGDDVEGYFDKLLAKEVKYDRYKCTFEGSS
jgi:hypothetical protein